nr:histidine kinase [Stenotrophomonas sp.]
TLAGAEWWFLPLLDGDERAIGVAGMRFPRSAPRLTPEQRQLAEAMVDDIAQAALRTRLVADLEKAHVSNETERLRSALLSSVSHDLRSPLAAMIGSADSLSNYAEAMDASDRRALLDTILVEGERLDRYIQNLLDMTRLGHEGLKINRDWIGVDELVGSAARRLQRYQPDVRLQLDIPSTLGPIWVHPALVEQAVFNVMENAAKFSPPGAAVEVQARLVDGELRIDVLDAGPGIPDDERARIFDMFYSVERGDRGRHGTGLGLTITQGMVGAHGGSVQALPGRDGRGTLIRITLPLLQPHPADDPDDS